MAVNSKYISASGYVSYEDKKITLPSGVFGLNVDAYLSSLNATFGFNQTSHRFDLEYVPSQFSFKDLPSIGSGVALTIGDEFYIQGRITHADYSRSTKGNTVSISIEDNRSDLKNTFIDVTGIFGETDGPQNGVVDVIYWYLANYVDSRRIGRSMIEKELFMLEQHGASYRQIYEAVKYFETLGNISGISTKIPPPEVIESQLSGNAQSYRWKFKCQPLIEVLTKILTDISYDWYWDMREQKVNVINNKYEITINESNIPIPGDTAPIISMRYGKDLGEEATTVQLYGDEMEGIIGGGDNYGTDSGAFGYSVNQYNLGLSLTKRTLKFVPAWRDITVRYNGADGYLLSEIPSDREYAMALKGIEFWAKEKGIDNRLTTSTIYESLGTTEKQYSPYAASGRPGLIENRATQERNWVIEWYNKVRSVAQNYYSRAYKLATSDPLYGYLDQFDVIPAAWCNIENFTSSSGYPDDYVIQNKYSVLAPFWDQDNNKMKAYSAIPSSGYWGEDGKAAPGSFENWTEIQNDWIVPIEVRKWSRTNNKFSDAFIKQFDKYEQGILIILPNLCWQTYYTLDPALQKEISLATLQEKWSGDTTFDFESPLNLPKPFEVLENIALPVRVRRRYGYQFPTIWASGTGSIRKVEILEELSPWRYVPQDNQTSVTMMNNDAQTWIRANLVSRDTVTFAEAQKIGLPIISFDGFANQDNDERGYGIVNHGVSNLSISKGMDWWQTKYSLKSHFPQFLKVKPVVIGAQEDFHFVLHRFGEEMKRLIPPNIFQFTAPTLNDKKTDYKRGDILDILEKFEVAVTIEEVYNRNSLTQSEYYLGIDADGVRWPRALDTTTYSSTIRLTKSMREATCLDGYLQIGMSAVYHYEDLPNGSFKHWFTGGIPLSAGRAVQLVTIPRLLKSIWVADCRTIPTTVTRKNGSSVAITPFKFYDVPFMFQQSVDTGMAVDDKMMILSNQNKNNLIPGRNYGPNSTTHNQNDCYLANSSVPSDLWIGHVTVKPNTTTGRSGSIQTITAAGGVVYADGATIGGSIYNVYFVGCEYDQIEVGDYCVVKRERESGIAGQFRLYCLVQKPLFMGSDALGG